MDNMDMNQNRNKEHPTLFGTQDIICGKLLVKYKKTDSPHLELDPEKKHHSLGEAWGMIVGK